MKAEKDVDVEKMKENGQERYCRNRKKKRKGRMIQNIILILCLIVFCVSAFQLIKIIGGYWKGQGEYEKIQDLVLELNEESEGSEDGGEDTDHAGVFRVNFDELLRLNPDTAAWIRFYPEPSVINYPVVQGKDNNEYLHRTFSGKENTLGTIFVSEENAPDFQDKNTVIFGHRMKNGSMFRHLEDYKDQNFWKDNPYFYLYTPDGYEHRYHIYSTGVVTEDSETYQIQFASAEEFQTFLNMTKETAEYDTGVEVTEEDTIVTLSTCTGASDNHRYVVRGVLEESIPLNEGE